MSIFSKPSSNIKSRIAIEWFGLGKESEHTSDLEDLFAYYEEELNLLRVGAAEETWQAAHLAFKTHENVLDGVRILAENQNDTKAQTRDRLSVVLSETDTEKLDRSIDLCVRLWLMLNVRDLRFQSLRPLETCMQWKPDQGLTDFAHGAFKPRLLRELSLKDARFDIHFTAASMIDICGLRIHWTRNLHDHLLLNRRKKLLSVFAYEHQLKYSRITSSPIPVSVAEETVRSLNLLFPAWDHETQQILQQENRSHAWWAGSSLCENGNLWDGRRGLNLNDFSHWQQRLLELNEEVFNAPAVTWKQLWKDRRNPQLFYTFWLAFAIFLLTLGQFVTSIVQAWASLQALKHSQA